MQAFEGSARHLRMRSMRLSVYPSNLAARGLYEKCGWQSHPMPASETAAMYYSKLIAEASSEKLSARPTW